MLQQSLDLLQLIERFLLIFSNYLRSEKITAINFPKSDINDINFMLRFKWSKMTKRACNGAKLHAKLENKLSSKLQQSYTQS